mmetsp:Transcript_1677/g.3957  ORF Transcript_1677/g.3957 Transcript_1677/m.3957 type:complete len:257 (+) Transcript_1677:535-1305(+)
MLKPFLRRTCRQTMSPLMYKTLGIPRGLSAPSCNLEEARCRRPPANGACESRPRSLSYADTPGGAGGLTGTGGRESSELSERDRARVPTPAPRLALPTEEALDPGRELLADPAPLRRPPPRMGGANPRGGAGGARRLPTGSSTDREAPEGGSPGYESPTKSSALRRPAPASLAASAPDLPAPSRAAAASGHRLSRTSQIPTSPESAAACTAVRPCWSRNRGSAPAWISTFTMSLQPREAARSSGVRSPRPCTSIDL